jgi:hypothetical protein
MHERADDPMVELLIARALRLGHDAVDTQLAAGELIRTAGGDLQLLRRAHRRAVARWPDFGDGRWIGQVLTPLYAAVVSLEEEEHARAAARSA